MPDTFRRVQRGDTHIPASSINGPQMVLEAVMRSNGDGWSVSGDGQISAPKQPRAMFPAVITGASADFPVKYSWRRTYEPPGAPAGQPGSGSLPAPAGSGLWEGIVADSAGANATATTPYVPPARPTSTPVWYDDIHGGPAYDTTSPPAYEINDNPSVPIGAEVELWPSQGGECLFFIWQPSLCDGNPNNPAVLPIQPGTALVGGLFLYGGLDAQGGIVVTPLQPPQQVTVTAPPSTGGTQYPFTFVMTGTGPNGTQTAMSTSTTVTSEAISVSKPLQLAFSLPPGPGNFNVFLTGTTQPNTPPGLIATISTNPQTGTAIINTPGNPPTTTAITTTTTQTTVAITSNTTATVTTTTTAPGQPPTTTAITVTGTLTTGGGTWTLTGNDPTGTGHIITVTTGGNPTAITTTTGPGTGGGGTFPGALTTDPNGRPTITGIPTTTSTVSATLTGVPTFSGGNPPPVLYPMGPGGTLPGTGIPGAGGIPLIFGVPNPPPAQPPPGDQTALIAALGIAVGGAAVLAIPNPAAAPAAVGQAGGQTVNYYYAIAGAGGTMTQASPAFSAAGIATPSATAPQTVTLPVQPAGGLFGMLMPSTQYVLYRTTPNTTALPNGPIAVVPVPSGQVSATALDVGQGLLTNLPASPPSTNTTGTITGAAMTGVNIVPQTAPGAVTVTPMGTPGATSVTYGVTAIDATGETPPTSGTTTTSNAVISSANPNNVTWTASPTAPTKYGIYRSGNLIGTVPAGAPLVFLDTGGAAGAAAPGSNTTGGIQQGGVNIFPVSTANGGLGANVAGAAAGGIPIANGSGGFTVGSLTGGAGVTVTNGPGATVTITAAGGKTFTSPSGTTTDANATVFDASDGNGLLGVFCIKNTGAHNLAYTITTTDMFSNTGGASGTLSPSAIQSFSLQSIGSAFAPFTEVKLEVKSSTAGQSTTYQVYKTQV